MDNVKNEMVHAFHTNNLLIMVRKSWCACTLPEPYHLHENAPINVFKRLLSFE